MNDDNPYRTSSEVEAGSVATQAQDPKPAGIMVGWVLVFLINLPMPVLFGLYLVATPGGFLGMAGGCLIWCGTGIAVCFSRHAAHVRATSLGGVLVALSQFYPLLQMYAGLLAIFIVSPLLNITSGQIGHDDLETGIPLLDAAYSGLLTLMTGATLITVAWLTGHLMLSAMRVLERSR